jgi:hypothetical protein
MKAPFSATPLFMQGYHQALARLRALLPFSVILVVDYLHYVVTEKIAVDVCLKTEPLDRNQRRSVHILIGDRVQRDTLGAKDQMFRRIRLEYHSDTTKPFESATFPVLDNSEVIQCSAALSS